MMLHIRGLFTLFINFIVEGNYGGNSNRYVG